MSKKVRTHSARLRALSEERQKEEPRVTAASAYLAALTGQVTWSAVGRAETPLVQLLETSSRKVRVEDLQGGCRVYWLSAPLPSR